MDKVLDLLKQTVDRIANEGCTPGVKDIINKAYGKDTPDSFRDSMAEQMDLLYSVISIEEIVYGLIDTLIYKDDLCGFLNGLLGHYSAKSAYVFEEIEGGYVSYTCSDEDNSAEIYKQIVAGDYKVSDSNLLASLDTPSGHVGYIVIEGCENASNRRYVLDKTVNFLAQSLSIKSGIERLAEEADLDILTGLHSRNKYIKKIDELRNNVPSTLGIMFIDINSLKEANDKYGHDYGDKLITSTSKIINELTTGYGYRFGGDEFIVVVENVTKEKFDNMSKNLAEALSKLETHTVSIGESYRDAEVNIDEQIQIADSLMYNNKEKYYSTLGNDRRRKEH